MSSNIEKVKSIFKSPGIAAVLRWSKCVHVKVVAVCLITVLATVFSLLFTLATKGLVDGAVSSNSDQLVKYALMLVGIILMQHLLSNVRSWLRIHASAELQESLQKMLVHEVLSKEYGGLKGYHSGELVNRVFSDMSVIKNGIMSILPSLIGIVVSFVGAAGILIAMDWHFVILMLAGGALGLALVNDIMNAVSAGTYTSRTQDDVTMYFDGNDVKCVVVPGGTNGSTYSRYFYFDHGQLFFAYYEGKDAHRLYFKDDVMFRWRYCTDKDQPDNAENYDQLDTEAYRAKQEQVLADARRFRP